jgi:hypothetical protein
MAIRPNPVPDCAQGYRGCRFRLQMQYYQWKAGRIKKDKQTFVREGVLRPPLVLHPHPVDVLLVTFAECLDLVLVIGFKAIITMVECVWRHEVREHSQ